MSTTQETQASDELGEPLQRESLESYLNGKKMVLEPLRDRLYRQRFHAAEKGAFSSRFWGHGCDGFYSVAEVLAEADGVNLEPNYRRFARLDEPVATDDIGVTRFIHRTRGGLVHYDPRYVSLLTLIKNVCAAFPAETIAIMLPSREAVSDLRSFLINNGIDIDAQIENDFGDIVSRVVVGTVFAFAEDDVEFQKRDILLFPFAQTASFESTQSALLHPSSRFRIFGFLADSERLTRCECDHMIGIFGVEEIVVPAHCNTRALAYFNFTRGPNGTPPGESPRALWGWDERNRIIANEARWARRCLAKDAYNSPSPNALVASNRTIVICQSIPHAVKIGKYLRGWPIVHGDDIDVGGLSAAQTRRLKNSLSPFEAPSAMIATVAGLSKIWSPARLQIIIWAGVGPSIPSGVLKLLNVPTLASVEIVNFALVVDIDDHSSPTLCGWAQQRRREYRQYGFLPSGREAASHGRELNAIALRTKEER